VLDVRCREAATRVILARLRCARRGAHALAFAIALRDSGVRGRLITASFVRDLATQLAPDPPPAGFRRARCVVGTHRADPGAGVQRAVDHQTAASRCCRSSTGGNLHRRGRELPAGQLVRPPWARRARGGIQPPLSPSCGAVLHASPSTAEGRSAPTRPRSASSLAPLFGRATTGNRPRGRGARPGAAVAVDGPSRAAPPPGKPAADRAAGSRRVTAPTCAGRSAQACSRR
jgi:hypothetical protein